MRTHRITDRTFHAPDSATATAAQLLQRTRERNAQRMQTEPCGQCRATALFQKFVEAHSQQIQASKCKQHSAFILTTRIGKPIRCASALRIKKKLNFLVAKSTAMISIARKHRI